MTHFTTSLTSASHPMADDSGWNETAFIAISHATRGQSPPLTPRSRSVTRQRGVAHLISHYNTQQSMHQYTLSNHDMHTFYQFFHSFNSSTERNSPIKSPFNLTIIEKWLIYWDMTHILRYEPMGAYHHHISQSVTRQWGISSPLTPRARSVTRHRNHIAFSHTTSQPYRIQSHDKESKTTPITIHNNTCTNTYNQHVLCITSYLFFILITHHLREFHTIYSPYAAFF